MPKQEKAELLIFLNTDQVNIADITNFVLHNVYHCSKREKTPGNSQYSMLFAGKDDMGKFASTKSLPPGHKSLTMRLLRANLISHGWFNCLGGNFQQLDPLNYSWKYNGDVLQPLWYHGNSIPSETEIEDQRRLDSEEFTNPEIQECSESETSGDEYNVTSKEDSESDAQVLTALSLSLCHRLDLYYICSFILSFILYMLKYFETRLRDCNDIAPKCINFLTQTLKSLYMSLIGLTRPNTDISGLYTDLYMNLSAPCKFVKTQCSCSCNYNLKPWQGKYLESWERPNGREKPVGRPKPTWLSVTLCNINSLSEVDLPYENLAPQKTVEEQDID